MKNSLTKIVFTLFLLPCLMFCGCNQADDKPKEIKVQGVVTEFAKGSAFDFGDDAIVKVVTQSGKQTELIRDDFIIDFSRYNKDKIGTYDIFVKYKEDTSIEVSYQVEVKILTFNNTNINASGYLGVYDGHFHSIELSCDVPDVSILYASNLNGNYQSEMPEFKDVGTYKIFYMISKAGYQTYYGEQYVKIQPADLTVTLGSASIKYGETLDFSTLKTPIYTGFMNNETEAVVTGNLEYTTNYNVNDSVGEYVINATGLSSKNYNITYVSGTLTVSINQFLDSQITAYGWSGTYDGQDHNIYVYSKVSGSKITYSTTKDGEYTTQKPTYKNVVNATIYFKVEKDGYQTYYGERNIIINKAQIKVTLKDVTINYGDEIPSKIEIDTVTGLKNGETTSIIRGKIEYQSNYSAGDPTGIYELTATGLTATNYDFIIEPAKIFVI